MPGPLSCLLDCRPPLLGAWSACPANVILTVTARSPLLSLWMFMEASLQVLRSLRKVHSKLWTFPAPTILVGGRDVWLGSLK